MSSTGRDVDGSDDVHDSTIRANTLEPCSECDEETPHVASLTLKHESEQYGGAQPYRVAECLACGHVAEERIGTGGAY